MTSDFLLRCSCLPGVRVVYVALFLEIFGVTQGQAKIGENLPALIKRFGNRYTVEGAEEAGSLKYKFRLKTYGVDAAMSRRDGELVSVVEVYYSEKPLQPNGEPPSSTVRGIMNMNVPGAKWRELSPVGGQKEAFLTTDGVYMTAILPPDKTVDPNATFTVAVAKLRLGSGGNVTNAPSTGPIVVASPSATPVPVAGENQASEGVASPPPVCIVHLDSAFVASLLGKTRTEVRVTLGSPWHEDDGNFQYQARVPGYVSSENTAVLFVYFVNNKARLFQIVDGFPFKNSFLNLCLENSPGAHFEPAYRPDNLTGANWEDKASAFYAQTKQLAEGAYSFYIDLTPSNERPIRNMVNGGSITQGR